MAATNFNTKNDTFRKLFGNGLTYCIPRFQRDYSWSEEEWDDLWQDILGTINEGGEPAHYMGYLVLQSTDDKRYDVIDGQQRLTTLSIIVLVALKHLQRLIDAGKDPERTQQRLTQLRQTYIGYLDPVTLVPQSKLTLNRNNNDYYQTYLVPLTSPLPQRGFRASEHALRKAFEWFDKQLDRYLQPFVSSDLGMIIAQFIETMSDRLFFTVITVTDELNAYKVFETLNARGVRLSATDLLKNYLFSVLHRQQRHSNELDMLESRWEQMVGRLGSESFPDFLRTHWNSRHSFVRQTELFKVIRSQHPQAEDIFRLLREMDEDIDTYLALTHPEGSSWQAQSQRCAIELRMFSVRQPFSLLMSAKRQLNEQDFEDLLRACVVISLRYNVIGGLLPGEQERIYHDIAVKIARGELQTLSTILAALRPVYPNDDAFRAAFSAKSIKTTASRNRKIVRYLLFSLESQKSHQDFDIDSPKYTIEHILPQNPDQAWNTFPEQQVDEFVYRIGNLTLLESTLNRAIGNQAFADKTLVYSQSSLALTRSIATNHAEWTPARIMARQQELAKLATSIWRITQLS